MILDVHVSAGGVTPEAVADEVAAALGIEVSADERGNPKLTPPGGLVRVARLGYDRAVVYAEVRSDTAALAWQVYDALVARTSWDVTLLDTSDDHPEDVVLRSRVRNAA
ncbi:hypothetical protein ACXYTP_00065 [Tsukamurella ocularis]|uniref:hypothetical protein n=1 Tax=Tsukamurella ocularis TaxID=1970234 RepID=UPI0039EF78CB